MRCVSSALCSHAISEDVFVSAGIGVDAVQQTSRCLLVHYAVGDAVVPYVSHPDGRKFIWRSHRECYGDLIGTVCFGKMSKRAATMHINISLATTKIEAHIKI